METARVSSRRGARYFTSEKRASTGPAGGLGVGRRYARLTFLGTRRACGSGWDCAGDVAAALGTTFGSAVASSGGLGGGSAAAGPTEGRGEGLGIWAAAGSILI